MGWYDRKVRCVRDLSCGDTRIFLELEVRRVDCRRCGKVRDLEADFPGLHVPPRRAKGFDVRERVTNIVRLRDVPREFLT